MAESEGTCMASCCSGRGPISMHGRVLTLVTSWYLPCPPAAAPAAPPPLAALTSSLFRSSLAPRGSGGSVPRGVVCMHAPAGVAAVLALPAARGSSVALGKVLRVLLP
jgi:hypothetical protein